LVVEPKILTLNEVDHFWHLTTWIVNLFASFEFGYELFSPEEVGKGVLEFIVILVTWLTFGPSWYIAKRKTPRAPTERSANVSAR